MPFRLNTITVILCAIFFLFTLSSGAIGTETVLELDTLEGIESYSKANKSKGDDHIYSASEVYETYEKAVVIIILKIKGKPVSHGSGFFVKPNGYILTNNHVIDVSSFGKFSKQIEYEVVTSDGGRYIPQVVKVDPDLDIALLKLHGKTFPSVQIGTASRMKVGDEVFIVGTPIRMEFRRSLTSGIISGFNRSRDRIQTSAILHGGNSGGPAFNNRGMVCGIAIAVAAGINKEKALINNKLVDLTTQQKLYGISYLIPIDYSKNLLRLMY